MSLLETPGERLLEAVRGLLIAKGITDSAEIAERIRITDDASPALGAAMVARAWTDPEFRALMLADGTRAAESMDIPMRGLPPLGVLENTGTPTTSSSAPCARAIRARCWDTHPSGSNPPPTAPAPCATRAACWRNGAPRCRTA